MLGGIVRKRQVLELIAERTKDGKETSFRTLVSELWLPPEAACSHLKRLWRERLIKNADWPSSYGRAAAFRKNANADPGRLRAEIHRARRRAGRRAVAELVDPFIPAVNGSACPSR